MDSTALSSRYLRLLTQTAAFTVVRQTSRPAIATKRRGPFSERADAGNCQTRLVAETGRVLLGFAPSTTKRQGAVKFSEFFSGGFYGKRVLLAFLPRSLPGSLSLMPQQFQLDCAGSTCSVPAASSSFRSLECLAAALAQNSSVLLTHRNAAGETILLRSDSDVDNLKRVGVQNVIIQVLALGSANETKASASAPATMQTPNHETPTQPEAPPVVPSPQSQSLQAPLDLQQLLGMFMGGLTPSVVQSGNANQQLGGLGPLLTTLGPQIGAFIPLLFQLGPQVLQGALASLNPQPAQNPVAGQQANTQQQQLQGNPQAVQMVLGLIMQVLQQFQQLSLRGPTGPVAQSLAQPLAAQVHVQSQAVPAQVHVHAQAVPVHVQAPAVTTHTSTMPSFHSHSATTMQVAPGTTSFADNFAPFMSQIAASVASVAQQAAQQAAQSAAQAAAASQTAQQHVAQHVTNHATNHAANLATNHVTNHMTQHATENPWSEHRESAAPPAEDYSIHLRVLTREGFTDQELNLDLLRQYDGNVVQVLRILRAMD
eukprot:g38456.t1